MTPRRTEPGTFYRRGADGLLSPAAPGQPDVWICRRIADYAPAPVPAAAARTICAWCRLPIAYNPARVAHVAPSTPKVCMQCAGIEPLPIEA